MTVAGAQALAQKIARIRELEGIVAAQLDQLSDLGETVNDQADTIHALRRAGTGCQHDEVVVTSHANDDRVTWQWFGDTGRTLIAREILESLLTAVNERDSARDVAVRLEQECAHLTDLLAGIATDLREMWATFAVDVDTWPAAKAILEHVGEES